SDLGSDGLGDLLGVSRRPDTRTVDAAATAIHIDAVDHDVDVFLPLIDHIIAEQNLAETGAVGLYSRVALVLFHRGGSAEDETARTVLQHGSADFAEAGVDGDGLWRNAGLNERIGHAIRRPRFLRAGFENQPDLHGDDRQPQSVH